MCRWFRLGSPACEMLEFGEEQGPASARARTSFGVQRGVSPGLDKRRVVRSPADFVASGRHVRACAVAAGLFAKQPRVGLSQLGPSAIPAASERKLPVPGLVLARPGVEPRRCLGFLVNFAAHQNLGLDLLQGSTGEQRKLYLGDQRRWATRPSHISVHFGRLDQAQVLK